MQLLPSNVPRRTVFMSAFIWAIWVFCVGVIGSQFLGIFWNSMVSSLTVVYGRSPLEPMTALAGFNDEAYADRAIVCIAEGNAYIPKQLSKVLKDPMLAKPASDSTVNGFRVVKRESMTLSQEMYDSYARVCDRLAFTLAAIQDSCGALGFNVTRDGLRIANGIEADADTLDIARALPVLIVPYWDNTLHAYYVTPSWDGAACVYSLSGTYQSAALKYAILHGVPRSIRTSKAEEWLQKPGGQWRNGWYEDPQGQPWMANMMTSKNGNWLGIEVRQFDTLDNKELDCDAPETASQCKAAIVSETWGKRFTTISEILQNNQVFISNGKRFGLFMSDDHRKRTTVISYPLETFISNVSLFLLLFRWFVGMASMQNSFRRGVSTWQTAGVGCLSSARTFNILPIMLLPQLKMTLTVFCSTGCFFEGQQSALTNACLLNIVGKITYRRVSDALFGPTLLLLCAIHYFRVEIAQIKWLGLNERISTVLLSDQVDKLTLADFFTTDVALQLNGNIQWLFFGKLSVLALSLLPLIFSEKMTERGVKARTFVPCEIENALALRASTVGGLGRSPVYANTGSLGELRLNQRVEVRRPSTTAPMVSHIFRKRVAGEPAIEKARKTDLVQPIELEPLERDGAAHHVLLSYELNRLGYLVFGGKFLISYDDWYVLVSMAPLRMIERLWNYRVSVFTVTKSDDGMYFKISPYARLVRLDDPQLRVIPFHDVTVCAFQ